MGTKKDLLKLILVIFLEDILLEMVVEEIKMVTTG